MDIELFDKLMEQQPTQDPLEWKMFLEVCEMYLKKHEIKNPIVVELGVHRNYQKKFYEQLLGAAHIGIDRHVVIDETGIHPIDIPDIIGDTHDPKTREILKDKLQGRPIDILFIDASHYYEAVKRDFTIYSPLCTAIIAFHDIDLHRDRNDTTRMVWKFWDEVKDSRKYGVFTTLSIHQYRNDENQRQMGIGMMMRNHVPPLE